VLSSMSPVCVFDVPDAYTPRRGEKGNEAERSRGISTPSPLAPRSGERSLP